MDVDVDGCVIRGYVVGNIICGIETWRREEDWVWEWNWM